MRNLVKIAQTVSEKIFKTYTTLYMYIAQVQGQITQGDKFLIVTKSFITLIIPCTRVVQKVLLLIAYLVLSQVYFKMLHCTLMVCWIADDTRLFRGNCFPTDRVISNWNRCSHIHWPIYLLHWNMDQKTEIRSYIKCRIRLNRDSKQVFNELCGIYGPHTISMRTGFRRVKTFKTGKFSVEDDPSWKA